MSDSVISEIASAIHVRQIQTPIAVAEPFTRNSSVGEVADHMERFQYDVTPVFPADAVHPAGERPDPNGTLWRSDLSGLEPESDIRRAVRSLSGTILIGSRANLLELLDRFRASHTFLLVVGSGGIDGIVTPSDMNKQAGRTHLFMHLSALELALADRLRNAEHSDEDVLRLLSSERARSVLSRLRRQRNSDQAADLAATLDFHDLLVIERQLGTSGLSALLRPEQMKGLADFRNKVMHSVLRPASDVPEQLNELLERTQLVGRLIEAVAHAQPPN